MDRKWRTNKGALHTVLSFPEFARLASPWKSKYTLASLTDLYSVYTVLHIEGKEWELKWSEEGLFYYFLAKETIHENSSQIIAPEGDEDVPDLVPETEAGDGAEIQPQLAEKHQKHNDDSNNDIGRDTGIDSTNSEEANHNTNGRIGPKIRTQLIVPISSASNQVTPALMQRLFLVRGVQVQQVILGLVDSNGVVSRSCLFNYIQAPLEGPGTENMDKLKKKLKKLGLNSSSIGLSNNKAFSGTGHKLGGGDPKAPQAQSTAHTAHSSASHHEAPRTQEIPTPIFQSQTPPPPLSNETKQQQQQQQIQHNPQLRDAVNQLKTDSQHSQSAHLITRLFTNITTNSSDEKFRKIRLTNPKIQSGIVDVNGGIELLLACGFQLIFESVTGRENDDNDHHNATTTTTATIEEGFAILPLDANLEAVHDALTLLQPLLSPSNTAVTVATNANDSSFSGSGTDGNSKKMPAKKEREFDSPCARNTRIILPVSVDHDVPEWFFQRTGSELKAAFMSAIKQREQSQYLMTKQMRERQAKAQHPTLPPPNKATVKIRLPEGISIQGEFQPNEPVAAVFAWMAENLCDPMQTYELVLPDRNVLDVYKRAGDGLKSKVYGSRMGSSSSTGTGSRRLHSSSTSSTVDKVAQSVKEAGLMPSITLNLRWTNESEKVMKMVPALRSELMMELEQHRC